MKMFTCSGAFSLHAWSWSTAPAVPRAALVDAVDPDLGVHHHAGAAVVGDEPGRSRRASGCHGARTWPDGQAPSRCAGRP
jgi:hypothetical protein